MNDIQLILVILGGLFALFQVTLIFLGVAAVVNSRRNVRVSFISGIMAALLFIVAVLV